MSDAIDDLARALVAQERAEDDPAAAAEVERCRKLYEAAEAAVGFARGRRRELEAQLDPAEVVRAYSQAAVGRR